MLSRLYRLATCAAGLILLCGAYNAGPSIALRAAPQDAGLAAVLGIMLGLGGMVGGVLLILFSLFAPDETL